MIPMVALFTAAGLLLAQPVPDASPKGAPDAAAVLDALSALDDGEDAAVSAMLRGDLDALNRIAGRDAEAGEVLRDVPADRITALPWPDRTRWMERLLADGLVARAPEILEALGDAFPPPGPGRGEGALARGLLAEAAEARAADPAARAVRGALADEAFAVAAAEPGLLRDLALARCWRRADARGDSAAAEAWADSLVAVDPRSPFTPEARISRLRRAFREGAYDRVIEESRLMLPEVDTPELHRLLAEARIAGGEPLQGTLELESLIGNFGRTPEAVAAWRRRVELGEGDPALRLTSEQRLDLWFFLLAGPESAAFEDSLRRFREDPAVPSRLRVEATRRLGEGYFKARRYDDAIPMFRALLAEPGKTAVDARLGLARVFRNTIRPDSMSAQYRAVIAGGGSEAGTALWELGRELESLTRFEDAAATWRELLAKRPGDRHADDARFRLGYCLYREGDLDGAAETLRAAFAAAHRPEDKERAAWWRARALQAAGRDSASLAAARAGAWLARPADGYGVLLSREFLPESVEAEVEPAPVVETLENVLSDERWSPRLVSLFRRALAFSRLGERDAARRLLRQADRIGGDTPGLSRALALAAARVGVYPEGVTWAREAGASLPAVDARRPGYARLEFPPAFFAAVLPAAAEAGLDPRLIWAVMRQESLYDPLAVSRAGARGLLQVMPATLADLVAEGKVEPIGPEGLFFPGINVPIGVGYLAHRIDGFGGLLLPALAGYNAGAPKCREWIEKAGEPGEGAFIEAIGYPETYGYVRRILWLNDVYRDLYRSTADGRN